MTYIRNVGAFPSVSLFHISSLVIPLACARGTKVSVVRNIERTTHVVASSQEFECVARVSSPPRSLHAPASLTPGVRSPISHKSARPALAYAEWERDLPTRTADAFSPPFYVAAWTNDM